MFVGAATLGSCGSRWGTSREETIEGAKEAIKSNANYDASENKLVIYQHSDNTLGDVSAEVEPKEEAVIFVRMGIIFYNHIVNTLVAVTSLSIYMPKLKRYVCHCK